MVVLADSLDSLLKPNVAKGLATLGVRTAGELLRYAPRRYVEKGEPGAEVTVKEGEWVTVVGRVTRSDMTRMKRRPGWLLRVAVTDDSRTYGATFFHPHAISKALKKGVRVMMAGGVSFFNGEPQLTHPQWMVLPEIDAEVERVVGSSMLAEMYAVQNKVANGNDSPLAVEWDRSIIPIYAANRDVQTWEIWGAVTRILEECETLDEALDDAERTSRGLITTDEAIRAIHLPDDKSDIAAARERLKFDEALAIQLVLAQRRMVGRGESSQACPYVEGGLEARLMARLPFTLTDGQRVVIDEIGDELGRAEPMSRLLQGEVGSGKTLVSLLAMLRVVDNGHQCAILAPTEVLAAQHFRTITTMLGDLGMAGKLGAADGATTVSLLTGSMKTKGRRQTMLDVVNGNAGIVIGTHALLEDKVEFFDLGMVVVDEQHRFGVEQRDVLRGKGRDGLMPHFLVMTATPIPRTVAMTVFGDLETSVLTELPRGRQPISTSVVPTGKADWVARVWSRAEEEIEAGRQVYVVCSRIGDDNEPAPTDPNSPAAMTSVLDQFAELQSGPLGDRRIGLLHGRMPGDEKNDVMDAFSRGEIDILVSTTVIEVGVDVPNATVMVIVDAERFGVSQLHQLRGRIGRGEHPGLCLLMTRMHPASQAMERLRAVEASNDGFELARVDLAQRREGDVLGSIQSGAVSSLHFLSLLDDGDLIADARDLAERVVDEDLTLVEHRPLADLVDAILVPQKIRYLDKS